MKKIKILLVTACISFLFSIQSFAGWVQQENGQWNYDQNGILVCSQWIEDQGSWYYFDANGVLLTNTTQNIDGVVYNFDATGKWIVPNSSSSIIYNTYNNTAIGYSLQIPSDLDTTAFDGNSETFDISSQNIIISFYNQIIPEYLDPAICATVFEAGFVSGIKGKLSYIDKSDTQLGEFAVTKTRYLYNDDINLDFYNCTRGYKTFVVCALYIPETQGKVQEILSTLKELR
ncbi:hypothetical protein [Lacrimispora sp.]|jgi:hypothetical protein|uniref:hypothetical protein n=1 Tax=Lacrimispora sp. TaxID=2719234 RepID=UPI00289FDCEC|nr:hypothetical protein [Lacrimispora sp.]